MCYHFVTLNYFGQNFVKIQFLQKEFYLNFVTSFSFSLIGS